MNAPTQNFEAVKLVPARQDGLFVSYAQNLEDVMLNRVFPGDHGFYIDVGAQHPLTHSTTHAFYKRGWHGINLEPNREYYSKLKAHRSRDINLQVAASDHEGEITFYEIAGTGLSTSVTRYADQATKSGLHSKKTTVSCSTLDEICREHHVTNVDFLKIDVEGAEEFVLRGFSFKAVRPTVLVIEATEPGTPFPSYQNWEPYLLTRDYLMAHDDGLNRFYLAKERIDLLDLLEKQPNVFDHYQVHMTPRQIVHFFATAALDQMPPVVGRSARALRRALLAAKH